MIEEVHHNRFRDRIGTPRHSTVTEYCQEEVSRQGHDVATLNGLERVEGMLKAWNWMLTYITPSTKLSCDILLHLGWCVERRKNPPLAFRSCQVRVGATLMPHPEQVRMLLDGLLATQDGMEPFAFYRAFLEIHPFEDGNGRVGKLLLNWKNGTLLAPVFPPADFWGAPIRNP